MYGDESSTSSRNWNENSDESPTKRMKSRGSMSLPVEVIEELIASYLHTHDLPELGLTTPWWSVEGEGTDAVQGVTYRNSKWNVWEIDLTTEDPSDCGSTSETLNTCGATEDYGVSRMSIEEIREIAAQEQPVAAEERQQHAAWEDDKLRCESRTIRMERGKRVRGWKSSWNIRVLKWHKRAGNHMNNNENEKTAVSGGEVEDRRVAEADPRM